MDVEGVDPLLVTIEGARRLIGIGTTKLYELINDGTLDVVKIGRRTLITFVSLQRLAGG